MITQNACLQTFMRLVLFAFILLSFGFANADEPAKYLHQRESVQTAEIDLIRSQLDLAAWKQAQLEALHREGFASWLETRKQQLTVDTIATRLESAIEFQRFLSDVANHYKSQNYANDSLYQPRKSQPVKIFLPGSLRIIGWIEGQTLVESTQKSANNELLKTAQEKLAKAQKRFDIVSKLPTATKAVRRSALLRLNLAKQELKYLVASRDFQESTAAADTTSFTMNEIEHLVTVEADPELKAATRLVAKAEAAAQWHLQTTKILLAREQRRAGAIADWQNQGHASSTEVKIVNERLADLNGQLNSFLENQKTLAASLSSLGDTNPLPSNENHVPVQDWPTEIFADQQFVLHVVDLRRNYHKEQALAETNRLKSEMLAEVLSRLQVAAAKSQANGKLDSVLTTGQQNEIKSYEADIELADAYRLASIEKQQILILEEKRFSHQAIAMHQSARNKLASTPGQDYGLLALSGLFHPTGLIAATGSAPKLTHCSYLERSELHRTAASSRLVFCQDDLQFLGGPFSNSIGRYSLLPIDTSQMTSYAGRTLYSPRRLEVEPQWMSYFRKNQARNVVSTYDFPQLWRNPHQHRYGRPFGNYWAYPNSVLRSELRGRTTPGQVPWYLPGSPGNIRSNQLKY